MQYENYVGKLTERQLDDLKGSIDDVCGHCPIPQPNSDFYCTECPVRVLWQQVEEAYN